MYIYAFFNSSSLKLLLSRYCYWQVFLLLGNVKVNINISLFKPTEICNFKMVGLGNSRRGIKSPPLLVAALVACIIVLGFNYWIASSRSVDLQVLLFCWFFTMSELYILFKNVGFYLKITMHFRVILSDEHLELGR